MGRILGLDHGTKRIGLAVSDALGLAAHGLPTLSRAGMEVDLAAIAALVAEREIDEVVVGLPRNMDGSEGLQAKQARAFAARLREALGLPVSFEDERLTSERAQRALAEGTVWPRSSSCSSSWSDAASRDKGKAHEAPSASVPGPGARAGRVWPGCG